MAWILTPDALADIERIAVDGALMFGRAQAQRYEADLVDRLDALAAHPYIAPAHITDGMELRLMPSGRHHILYVVESEDVVVLRVLHALQNWPDLL